MAIIYNDKLRNLIINFFPDNKRTEIWLCMFLKHWGYPKNNFFEFSEMRDRMAALITHEKLINIISDWYNYSVLSEDSLSWMEKTDRQSKFFHKITEGQVAFMASHMYPGGELSIKDKERKQSPFTRIPPHPSTLPNGNYIQKIIPDIHPIKWPSNGLVSLINNLPEYPPDLTAWEAFIALIDFWPTDKATKLFHLNNLKNFWVSQQRIDKKLSWYSQGAGVREKCQIAWNWYQDNHPYAAGNTPMFKRSEQVFSFLTESKFSEEEKLHHLEQIKKKFKAQQTKANRQGKKQTNTTLSDTARQQLDKLAESAHLTRTKVIELLIQNAYQNGMPE